MNLKIKVYHALGRIGGRGYTTKLWYIVAYEIFKYITLSFLNLLTNLFFTVHSLAAKLAKSVDS